MSMGMRAQRTRIVEAFFFGTPPADVFAVVDVQGACRRWPFVHMSRYRARHFDEGAVGDGFFGMGM